MNPELLDRVYEAAALPQQWPDLLHTVANLVGARGALIFTSSMDGSRTIASPGADRLITDFVADGWMQDNPRATPLVETMHPGFQPDSDYFSPERKAQLPIYRDFLIPRGFSVGAGTVIQGVNDDALVMTVEGFASEAACAAAIAQLNALRPHIARAASLSARVALGRSRIVVEGLDMIGTGAAVVGARGELRAANTRFTKRLGNLMVERRARLSFLDPVLDAQFATALADRSSGGDAVRSVVVRENGERQAFAIHVLPLRGSASNVFESDGMILLIADADNARIPNADLLRLLFDLTPAEARLARLLIEGMTLAEASARLRIGAGTARTHLRAVFGKTGINRQADLVRVLLNLSPPTA